MWIFAILAFIALALWACCVTADDDERDSWFFEDDIDNELMEDEKSKK